MEDTPCPYCSPNATTPSSVHEPADDKRLKVYDPGDVVAALASPHEVANTIYAMIASNKKGSRAPSFRSRHSHAASRNSSYYKQGDGRPAVMGDRDLRNNYEVYVITTYNGLSEYTDIPAFMHRFLIPLYPNNHLGCVRVDNPKYDDAIFDKLHIHTTPEMGAYRHPSGWLLALPLTIGSGRILHRFTINLDGGAKVFVKVVPEIYDQVLAMAINRGEWWRDFCNNLTSPEEAEMERLWQAYQVCNAQRPCDQLCAII